MSSGWPIIAYDYVVNEPAWDALPYTPDLAPGVLALCRRQWPDAEIADPGFHRWQYQENPAGPALSALARDRATGELIGQFGAVPLRVCIDGEERLAALALNVVTDAAHRGRGVFAGLGRAADEQMENAGASLAFAMPNESSFPGFVRRLGYTHVGDIPLLVRPVKVRRLVAARLRVPGLGALAAVLARPLFPPLPASAQQVPGVTASPVEEFGAPFDALWQRLRGRERVLVVRDATYLTWRFRRIPLRRYDALLATADGQPAGYVVLRVVDILGMRAGMVVDFLVDPAAEHAGRALVSAALAYFADKDVDLLAALMLQHAPEYRLLRRAGFRPLPRALLPQRFRLVARDGQVVRERRSWFLTMGDYDVV